MLLLLIGVPWKGLEDLRNGIIRTPLPPSETFQDDPLRVLRCIRFASRFGFEIVPEVQEAAKDPIIQVTEPCTCLVFFMSIFDRMPLFLKLLGNV
jgi:tRNA nucleotidyltransferase/poly(A) polymerase